MYTEMYSACMRLFLLFLLTCGSGFNVIAQQKLIDSLEKELAGTLHDTVRAMSMMRLAVNYEGVDTGKAAKIYKQTLEFCLNKKLDYITGRTYHNLAILQNVTGKYKQALISLDSAIYFLNKSNHPQAEYRKATVYTEMGNVSRFSNDFKKAAEYYIKGIVVFEKLGKATSLITGYINLSSFYKEQYEYEKQELYAKKALEQARILNTGDAYFKAYTFVALALSMQNKYEQAALYIDSAEKNYADNYTQEVLVSFHLVAGHLNMNLHQLDEAEENFTRSFQIAEKNKASFSITQSRLQLGRIFSLKKEFKKAEEVLLKAFEEAKSGQEASQMVIALENLARLYEEKGDLKKSLEYYKEFKIVADSISSDQNKKYASELEVQYESEKKENQIQQLEAQKKIQELTISKKNNLNYVLFGAVITAVLLMFLLYRTYQQKQKLQQQRINELETEKKLAAAEAVLRGEEKERTRLAKDLHDGLGGMLSGIKYSLNTMKGNLIMTPENAQAFERSMEMLDNSIKEMRRVAHNMMPEALVKFGLDTALRDFCSDINKSGALHVNYQSIGLESEMPDQTISITIYRIVQELIHNTIKHAQAKSALVQIVKNADQLSVTVEDDGKGFDTNILSASKGMGWSNIQNRIGFLKGKLDVHSQPGKGTSVMFEIQT